MWCRYCYPNFLCFNWLFPTLTRFATIDMTFWKSICQLKFLSVVLGLLSSSFLALGENENPGKTPTPPTTEKNVTSAMALQTALNQSLSVQNLNEMMFWSQMHFNIMGERLSCRF